LDYFQGILFLTTNRVGHFDEAFKSRIHLSLGYEKLTDDARARIWDNLFRKLGSDHKRGGSRITYEYDAKAYVKSKEVQALEWNGREIRNGNSLNDPSNIRYGY
jgi:ATP-dependent Clp protease ATP-binding subunit ClpA